MDDIDTEAIEALAGQAKRYLGWSLLFLAAMGCILVIDIMLARSIRDQAVKVSAQNDAASRLIGQRVFEAESGAGHGRAAPDVATASDDSGQPGSGRDHAVDGIPGVAAGADQEQRPKQARGRGVAQRPPRDEP